MHVVVPLNGERELLYTSIPLIRSTQERDPL